MAAIEQSVEIARSPEDDLAYLDKLDRHGEWQDGLVVEHRAARRRFARATR